VSDSSQISDSHIPALDGVRGLAIVLVVGFHSQVLLDGSNAGERLWLNVFSAGWSGVDLFFVLSGFLITTILIQSRGESNYFRNFFMRRVLRIFPLYFGSLLLLFSLLNVPELQWWYWLFVQNWVPVFDGTYQPMALQPFWSLAIEEQFYLVWPIIICLLHPRHILTFCVFATAVALAARCIAKAKGVDPWIIATVTPFRIDALALGALVASWRLGTQRERLSKLAPPIFLASAAGIIVIAITQSGYQMNGTISQTAGYTLFPLMCAALIAMIVDEHRLVRPTCRLLNSRVLRHLRGVVRMGQHFLLAVPAGGECWERWAWLGFSQCAAMTLGKAMSTCLRYDPGLRRSLWKHPR
jgi:peptidoglycan/LPS O-acetylase OafA/YrhL